MPNRVFTRFPFIQKPPQRRARSQRQRGTLNYSPIEVMFWNTYTAMRPRALRGLVRQYQVGRYRIDFAIPAQRFGIELDGHATHSSPAAIAADRARQRALEELGWHIVRFGGLEVYNNPEVCVRAAARHAGLHKMKGHR